MDKLYLRYVPATAKHAESWGFVRRTENCMTMLADGLTPQEAVGHLAQEHSLTLRPAADGISFEATCNQLRDGGVRAEIEMVPV